MGERGGGPASLWLRYEETGVLEQNSETSFRRGRAVPDHGRVQGDANFINLAGDVQARTWSERHR